MYSELIENTNKIIDNIKKVCEQNGRNFEDITIVAASKTRDIDTIKALVKNTPIKSCGENKVQEFNSKYVFDEDIDWQFIGQLQTNKVKYLIGKVSLIHSVDRESLAQKIDELSEKNGVVTNVLVEINSGHELTKGGVDKSEVVDFIKSLAKYKNIKILGIMSVLPNDKTEVIEPLYKELYNIFTSLNDFKQDNFEAKYLSAGMTNDYLLAIKNGANMVRIGTGIFGARNYNI